MALPTIDQAAADAYFLATARNASWAAVADADKAIALSEAQAWLGQLCWDQTADCCGLDFTTSYTRAVCELALALHGNPTALIAATPTDRLTKREKLGDLEVEYQDTTAGAVRYGVNAPLVLQRFPWLGDILGCWLNVPTGASRILARVRS